MKFDILSLFVSSILISSGFFVALMIIWKFNIRRKELSWWSFSQFFYSVGASLILTRGNVPEFFSIVLSNSFFIITLCCVWIGTSIYNSKSPHYRLVSFIILLFISLFIYFTYAVPNIAFRIIVFNFTAVGIELCILVTLIGPDIKSRFPAEYAAALTVVSDAVIRFTILIFQFRMIEHLEPFHKNIFIGSGLFLELILFIAWNLSVILMIFSNVFSQLKIAETEAIESKNLLERVLNAIPSGVFWKDMNMTYAGANSRFLMDLGFPDADSLKGKNDVEIFGSEKAQVYRSEDRQIIETGNPKLNYEDQIIKSDKSVSYILKSKTPLVDSKNCAVGVVGAYQDITEQKEAQFKINTLLKEKEILLLEVHHRIKNNMSTISSLLSIQADMMGESAAVNALIEAKNRVHSMTLIYDKLYTSSDYTNIPVKDYLERLISEISSVFPNSGFITVKTRIDDFELNSNTMFPVGILINEILTNSFKYAFPQNKNDASSCLIDVKMTKLENNMVNLIISDNGTGLTNSVNSGRDIGFGMLLVELLSEQLNAEVEIVTNAGTLYSILFPVR